MVIRPLHLALAGAGLWLLSLSRSGGTPAPGGTPTSGGLQPDPGPPAGGGAPATEPGTGGCAAPPSFPTVEKTSINFCSRARPDITSAMGCRSATRLLAVVRQFDVVNNPRYAKNRKCVEGMTRGYCDCNTGSTFCNVFVLDVLAAMGIVLPQSYMLDGVQRWMSASGMTYWLTTAAAREAGWREVSASEAVAAASQGFAVVAGQMKPGWPNATGSGHVAIVLPALDQAGNAVPIAAAENPNRPEVIQAGAKLTERSSVSRTFAPEDTGGPVRFFVHA